MSVSPISPEFKSCSRCRQRKDASEFYRNAASPDGLQTWCRECMLEAKRRRRQLTREVPPPAGPDEKWCRSCCTVKSLSAFGPHSATTDGLQSYCKACFAARYRRRRDAEGLLSRPAEIPEGFKFCRSCRQVLPLSEWAPRRNSTDGYHTRCRSCAAKRDRAYHIAKTYGVTIEEIDAIIADQNGKCAICLAADAIHIDHDHGTGHVRGVLCFRCNAALGQFGDQPSVLVRAARYLMAAASAPAPDVSRIEVTYTDRLAAVEFGSAS